jgi:ABC-2 type transport system permease protein
VSGTGSPSPVGLLLFLATRSIANATRTKLARLKEPRYLVGLLVGLAYLALVLFGRSSRRPPAARVAGGPFPDEVFPLFLLGASAVLFVTVLGGWLFRRGDAALPLSEGEVQFLFPAPLPRRALLHFGLLRPQLGILLGALFVTLVLGPRIGGDRWRHAGGLWLLLATLHFHFLALGFTKASWDERPAARRWLAKGMTYGLVVLALVVVGFGALDGVPRALASLHAGGAAVAASVEAALSAGPLGRFPMLLLVPFRALLAPLFAPSAGAFFAALPAALLLLAVQYLWVTWVSVGFEEATADNAARRARLRARRQSVGLSPLPSDRKRHVVPFALAPCGRPEIAIAWKNFLAWRRTRLLNHVFAVAAVCVVVLVGSSLAPFPQGDAIASLIVVVGVTVSIVVGCTVPLGVRNDLRGDLEYAASLRTWPVPAVRLVAAELLAPWLLSILYVWSGLTLALFASGGRAVRGLVLGPGQAPPALFAGFNRFEALLPAALSLAAFVPALMAVLFVLQNAAVVAFPAWFPPGRRRAAGLEQMGTRVVLFVATFFILAIALIPSALLAGSFFFLSRKALGLWSLPWAGLLAAAPLMAEAAAGIAGLARLVERFDPALDLLGSS